MRSARFSRLAAASLAAATCSLPTVMAETVNCTPVDTVPYTITAPGVYCLTGDLTGFASNAAITIQADNVTLDLNGYTLEGAGGTPTGIGSQDRSNVTLRNGRIVGFGSGVFLRAAGPTYAGSGGHLIEGLELRRTVVFGIVVMGRGNVIRGNRIVDTASAQGSGTAFGIWALGPAARVSDNDVIGTRGAAKGIYLANAPGSVVEGNRVTDTINPNQGTANAIEVLGSNATQVNGNRIANTTGYANSTGVSISSSSYVTVRDNVFNLLDFGIVFGVGAGTGKYMGNLASGVTSPYAGGIPAGATNY